MDGTSRDPPGSPNRTARQRTGWTGPHWMETPSPDYGSGGWGFESLRAHQIRLSCLLRVGVAPGDGAPIGSATLEGGRLPQRRSCARDGRTALAETITESPRPALTRGRTPLSRSGRRLEASDSTDLAQVDRQVLRQPYQVVQVAALDSLDDAAQLFGGDFSQGIDVEWGGLWQVVPETGADRTLLD